MVHARVGLGQQVFDTRSSMLLWMDNFQGTNIADDRYIWGSGGGLTAAQAQNILTLNSTPGLVDSNNIAFSTWRGFPVTGVTPVVAEIWGQSIGDADLQGGKVEWGLGNIYNATVGFGDGFFFRAAALNGIPTLFGVASYNGTETVVVLRQGVARLPDPTVFHRYRIEIIGSTAIFSIDDDGENSLVIPLAALVPAGSGAMNLQLSVHVLNGIGGGTVTVPRGFNLGQIAVYGRGHDVNRPWGHAMCGAGGHSATIPPGTAGGQTAAGVNVAPTAFTPVNNGAGALNALGGQFSILATAGSENDLTVFSFQVPSSSATRSGKTLYVTGIRIGEIVVNTVAVVTATTLQWGCANALGASMATLADGATAFGPRRVYLGTQFIAAAAAVGSLTPGLPWVDFSAAPIACQSRFNIFVKAITGAATATLAFRGTVTVNGYFE